MEKIQELRTGEGELRGWYFRHREDDGSRPKRTFLVADGLRKKDAESALAKIYADRARGVHVDARQGRATVAEYAKPWLGTLSHKDNSAASVRSLFENHVYNVPLGQMQIAAVRYSHVAGWVTSREKVLAPRTVRRIKSYISRMFADAVRDRVIPDSPCHGVKGPTVPRVPKEALSEDELGAVRDKLPLRWRDIVLVGRRCGLRPSELRGLSVDRVDFLRRTIKVDRQLLPGGFVPPKYDSYRTVIIDQETVDIIAAHLARWGEGPDRLIFTNTHGGAMSYSCLCDGWERAVRLAEARPSTPHAMRHHYASVLLERGVELTVVAEQLGHRDAGITASVYSHVIKGREEQRRAAIEAALAKKVDPEWTLRALPASGK
jgi:integrase